WTRLSSELWTDFAAEVKEASGVDPRHERQGGLSICLSEDELAGRRKMLEQIHAEQGETNFEYEILDRAELKRRLPAVGPEAVGAGYTRYDGAAHPLCLLRGLHAAILKRGGAYVQQARVDRIDARPNAFTLTAGGGTYSAPRLVLAAGLGNKALA